MFQYENHGLLPCGIVNTFDNSGESITPSLYDTSDTMFIQMFGGDAFYSYPDTYPLQDRDLAWGALVEENSLGSQNCPEPPSVTQSTQIVEVSKQPNAGTSSESSSTYSGSDSSDDSDDSLSESREEYDDEEDSEETVVISSRKSRGAAMSPKIVASKCPVSRRMEKKTRKTPLRMTKAQMTLLAPHLNAEIDLIDADKSNNAQAVAALKEKLPELSMFIKPSLITKSRRGQIMTKYTGRSKEAVSALPRATPKTVVRAPPTKQDKKASIIARCKRGAAVLDLSEEFEISRGRIYNWLRKN